MPVVHPIDIVSFSSEDPHHPASNLLSRETYKKWKCKEPGEKEAFVIMKFEKAIEITCIDIGNDGSALVEVSVARSGGGGEPQFEPILSSTGFMGPMDSRENKNTGAVKSFSLHSLCKPIAAQKWDLVKVHVSQPFNRQIQYGLKFIKFVAKPDHDEPQKIGMFGIRKPLGDDSDDEDDIRPGRLFFNRSPKNGSSSSQEAKSSSPSTNALIREESNKIASASSEKEVKALLQKHKIDLPSSSSPTSSKKPGDGGSPLLSRKKLEDQPVKKKDEADKNASSTGKTSNSSSTSAAAASSSKKRQLSPDASTSSKSNGTTAGSSPSKSASPAKKQKTAKKKQTKPFNKLFEGVVFSMSGFENPLRGQLRDKALEMGAKYKANWDGTCTHLICAFYNTPKFRDVRNSGNGVIVKKQWIEKSWADRIRYPWRRFCLDRNDNGEESEEEIHAINDDEEIIEDDDVVEPEPPSEQPKTKRNRVMVLDSSDEEENKKDDSPESKTLYDAETDVDEDKTPDLSPSLMEGEMDSDGSPIFENVKFYVGSCKAEDIPELKRIITKHKGTPESNLSDDTDYFLCSGKEWTDEYTDALSDNPNLMFVDQSWIYECGKEEQMLDTGSFLLTPS